MEDILTAFNIPIMKREGYEADDILGDLSYRAKKGKWYDYNMDMLILSGDKDLLQLIGDNVYVCLPLGSFKNLLIYDTAETVKKLGVRPDQIVDLKGLVGDPSDNIPGVKGVGMKSAVGLLAKYGSIDEIYRHLDEIPPRQAKLLSEGVEQMELSRRLATIVEHIDEPIQLEDCLMSDFDRSKVLQLFNEMEFRSLVSKIPKQEVGRNEAVDQLGLFGTPSGGKVDDAGRVDLDSHGEVYSQGYVEALEVMPEDFDQVLREVLGCEKSLIVHVGDPTGTRGGELFLCGVDNSGELSVRKKLLDRETATMLASGFTTCKECETALIGWEGLCREVVSYNLYALDNMKVNVFDLQLVAHLLSSGDKDFQVSRLVFKYLGREIPDIMYGDHGIDGVQTLFDLYEKLLTELGSLGQGDFAVEKASDIGRSNRVMQNAYYDYEQRLSIVLAKMENRGIVTDLKGLKSMEEELTNEISTIEQAIYHDIGHEINLNSPKQLAEVLYDELALPHGRGKSGRSTREDILKSSHQPIRQLKRSCHIGN